MKPCSTMAGDELGGRRGDVVQAGRAALELGQQLLVAREDVVREFVDAVARS